MISDEDVHIYRKLMLLLMSGLWLNKRTKKLKKSYSSIKTKRTQTAANVTLFGEHSALLLPTVVLLCPAALRVEREQGAYR